MIRKLGDWECWLRTRMPFSVFRLFAWASHIWEGGGQSAHIFLCLCLLRFFGETVPGVDVAILVLV